MPRKTDYCGSSKSHPCCVFKSHWCFPHAKRNFDSRSPSTSACWHSVAKASLLCRDSPNRTMKKKKKKRKVSDPSALPLLPRRDPFAAHRQQMRSMFGPFSMDPFALAPQIQAPRAPRRQVMEPKYPVYIFIWRFPHLRLLCTIFQAGALTPFGMMGMVSVPPVSWSITIQPLRWLSHVPG